MGIQIRNVQKRFGAITVVNGVSVDIADGEFFVMLGESGCGKTTTLRMVAGLELPTLGSIHINGKDVTFAEPRHRDIAMAFQDYGLYPNMTVFENIAFPLKIRKVPQADRRRKVEETAGKLGIADYLGRKPFQLSGGQRQRVSLARALVRNPKVFLMDEPLSNLDAKLRAVMRTEIKKLVSELGITTIYVTHDQIEAMSMADRIAVMRRGDMVQVGSPLEIYDRPLTRFVADFMGSPAMNLFPASLKTPARPTCQIQEFVDSIPDAECDLIAGRLDSTGQFAAGIRPEHLKLVQPGSPGSARAVVDFVEPLGQTTNVYLKVGETRFIAVTDRCSSHVGDVVGVYAPPEFVRVVAN
ncbi:ATP-binding cassette domain-containing protein [Rhizobium leguminosarum bv. viciae]|uniref:Sn-glycerol 3-phosphate transport system ATP-binding protein/multiple sugar transport system ATP-binding protein n=2 Tax=Rhizobium TaxID=379 RepID=A0AAX2QAD1_9HYPH|nr:MULTISPECIES: ABC transporter ATP-binding protein [Rhizobium]NKK29928.1 ATP-binding cassette domain-containing protein [Rhizobium leguminosarum bv. viciae]NKK39339.1 ATP-binding cassette domain-containing protein [Rhizobium leguminosarum bv. viciae]NKK64560.1 ATP-binding cassette domain-containing protein [Rhizobium leguminosarum bv. viciae]NKL86079.1 ATP-binding cassette domain-containing protein [Rhizobium leguminosarum bv. viciae]NKL91782.1 ATP-binding cassette domain-containing protein 